VTKVKPEVDKLNKIRLKQTFICLKRPILDYAPIHALLKLNYSV